MKFKTDRKITIDTPASDRQRLQIWQRLNIDYFQKDLTYLQAKDIIDNFEYKFEAPKNKPVRYI